MECLLLAMCPALCIRETDGRRRQGCKKLCPWSSPICSHLTYRGVCGGDQNENLSSPSWPCYLELCDLEQVP